MIKIYPQNTQHINKVVSQTSSVDVKCCRKKYIFKFSSVFKINVRKGHSKWHCDWDFLKINKSVKFLKHMCISRI